MSDKSEADDGRIPPPDDTVDGNVVNDNVDGIAVGGIVANSSPDGVDGGSDLGRSAGEVNLAKPDHADAGDAASDSSRERESELVGAVSAGSARAAARRSGARAGSTPIKGTATQARDTDRGKSENVLARLGRFLREVVAELRKVIWPARNQMITYTIVVIVFVVFMVAFTAGLDVLFAKGVLTIFG